ncbi:MAG TPA: hypothetical protein VGT98_17445 [Candidatus Elarobacter sp.]|nr:hypothetical protein [Candidatus Elarobacter sp.]
MSALIVSVLAACSDPGSPTAPTPLASADHATAPATAHDAEHGAPAHDAHLLVKVLDRCDGPTFNEAIGPGTCVRPHGLLFANFVDQLTANKRAFAWRNVPEHLNAKIGETVHAVNLGGEVHTFTRVAHFGGGIVPFLNNLAGTPDVVHECADLPPSEFMAPHGTDSEVLDKAGDIKFQCCIHPWMHTVVHVSAS